MALDFEQIYQSIKEIGAGTNERKMNLKIRREQVRALFNLHAGNLAWLRGKVEIARAAEPGLRCALPLNENLDFHAAAPELPENVTLIAADGSQIMPDRHNALEYGLINVGAIIFRVNSGAAPTIRTDSRLLFGDQLYNSSGGRLSEGLLAMQRDTEERSKLLELAKEFTLEGESLITFTDGPIELWTVRDGEDVNQVDQNVRKYLSVLSQLQERGITTAGYIDKPSSDPVVRLLELAQATDEDLQKLREYHPLRGVSDRWLFGDLKTGLLQPGDRSAVFGFQSKAENNYKGLLALHFFYLNISSDDRHPQIARIDIPKWVADDPQKLNLLHAAIIQQCQIMGAKPYPYLLQRAHECAVVSYDEKRQVDQMLALELQRNGEEVEDPSNKLSGKELGGRTRY